MREQKELITAQALANVLDLSVETIWRYTREGRIPCVTLGSKQYRYNRSDVLKALSTVGEKKRDYTTESEKLYTYQDYLEIPEEPGCRIEILEGVLIKEPSPNVMHQRVARRLQRILEDYFWEMDPGGEVFNAPLDVTLHEISVVQPDLFYVSGKQREITKDTRVDGSPTLVVEVISPSNGKTDRLRKMQIYQKYQVQHFWLANPDDMTLECYSLQNGLYALIAAGMDQDTVEHPGFPGLAIPLEELWKKGAGPPEICSKTL